ncbi:MAG: NADH-quinone oxidoreductase subunit L [Burkholderiaceae bacterium]
MTAMQKLYLLAPIAPLIGAIVAGLFSRWVGRAGSSTVTILGVLVSAIASAVVLADVLNGNTFNGTVYEWMAIGSLKLSVGFLIDTLSAMMMVVVTFVSLMVHIYTIGYMREDPGYSRFFAYISLFTFSMLMLVMSNNFLQLFFGWEAVGLVSYLLIGFWYTRPTAIYANMKAFLVNRVGDFGFLLGIGLVLAHFGTLDYAAIFQAAPGMADQTVELVPGTPWMLMSVIGICLFIGAMGKSAQFPLHVWLPDSMEGPTPISALIHAATMVTAGIFMVSRMSPLFELSNTALSFIIVIGAITAFFMGILAMVQNDIKRVVAYSTLSQLGYMTVALGASAYSAAMFHLMTHAFFKALLFLGAGSVIMGMHHQQDMRFMGGLRKLMPITWFTFLLASISSIGFPFFSGFYSKDSIIIAAQHAGVWGAGWAAFAVTAGVFITAFYTFRMYFMVFEGKLRADASHKHDPHGHDAHDDKHGHDDRHGGTPHESPAVVTVPLVLLAIPAVVIGFVAISPLLFGSFFSQDIFVDVLKHRSMAALAEEYHGPVAMAIHGFTSLPFLLSMAGVVLAWFFVIKRPDIPAALAQRFSGLHGLLVNKYYLDDVNQMIFANGAVKLGRGLWKWGDQTFIDGFFVNGSARLVGWLAALTRRWQSGYLFQYAFTMVIGVLILITLFVTLGR